MELVNKITYNFLTRKSHNLNIIRNFFKKKILDLSGHKILYIREF